MNTKLQNLQHLQKRVKTLIENSMLKDGWRCNWLSVSNIVQFDKAVMIYKIVNGLCPGQPKRETYSQISVLELLEKKSVRSGHSKVAPRVLKK